MNNQIMETLSTSSKKPYSFLSDEAKIIAQNIIITLSIDESDIKASTKNRIIILTDTPRKLFFPKLISMGYIRSTSMSGSSQGGFKSNNIEIIVKPKSGQGNQSSGKQNESSFIDLINDHIQLGGGSINITLNNNSKLITYENICKCIDSSVNGATTFAKADAQFLNKDGDIIANVSLKKRNAVRWESSKSRTIEGINVSKQFIEKSMNGDFKHVSLSPIEGSRNKYKLYSPTIQKTISKVIIKNTPHNLIDDVIFGNDFPKTVVIKEDFEEFTNYDFDGDNLHLNCYLIYDHKNDVIDTDDEPVFAFSNHIGQTHGIEFRSFSKGLLYDNNKIKGSGVEICFSDIK